MDNLKLHMFDDITYETVGIDPKRFYEGKFAGRPGAENILENSVNLYDIEYDRARFLASKVKGPNILDIGCGSGPYARTIRVAASPKRLVGIDFDLSCAKIAESVYDEVLQFELGKPLPFGDNTFDTVFSCDVFGHIEFRHKDEVIKELHRITARGGLSIHIIESGFLDYHAMNPSKEDDPIRKYIHLEGHIGVETASALKERWGRFFNVLSIRNAFIYPLAPLATYLADPCLPDDLRKIISTFDDNQKKAAQIVLGYVSQKLMADIESIAPEILVPDHTSPNPLQRPCGLVYLIAEKP